MALVACKCTSCGGTLEVDETKEAAVCQFCGTPFIVEKAINYYKTVNITMEQKDEQALIRKGLRMIEDVWFTRSDLAELAEDLSNISTNDFYPVFFEFCAGNKDKADWLIKNSDDEEKKIIIPFLFNLIVSNYNKESFEDVKLNIVKNYSGVPFINMGNDDTHLSITMLDKLTSLFTSEQNQKWEHLKEMADEELTLAAQHIENQEAAIAILGYAIKFTPIVSENTRGTVIDAVGAYAKTIQMNQKQYVQMVQLAKTLRDNGCDYSFFKYKVADGFYLFLDHIEVKGRNLPLEYPLRMINNNGQGYMLLKISDKEATIIQLNNCSINSYYMGDMPNCSLEYMSFFDPLLEYKKTDLPEFNCKLVYQEGFSYKRTFFEKAMGFLGKLIK